MTAKGNLEKSQIKQSPLEKEILKVVKKSQQELTKKDVEKIVKAVMPDLDKLIAEKVKKHFLALAEHISNSFKSEE